MTVRATARALVVSLRPRQWPKNAVVLVGLVFARELGQPEQVLRAVLGALLFCLLSGAVYLGNDLLVAGSLLAAFLLSPAFCGVALGYLGLQALYVAWLKHAVILDVMALAGGFVLRAVAGAVVVAVPISPWLYVCTMLLALFLALGKRRQELVLLEGNAGEHRPTLEQ